MSLDMLFEILRALERLSTEFTLVWLQGDMNSDVGCDVITLDGSGTALSPCAGQVEVVGRLSTDMALADMFLRAILDAVTLERSTRWGFELLT